MWNRKLLKSVVVAMGLLLSLGSNAKTLGEQLKDKMDRLEANLPQVVAFLEALDKYIQQKEELTDKQMRTQLSDLIDKLTKVHMLDSINYSSYELLVDAYRDEVFLPLLRSHKIGEFEIGQYYFPDRITEVERALGIHRAGICEMGLMAFSDDYFIMHGHAYRR